MRLILASICLDLGIQLHFEPPIDLQPTRKIYVPRMSLGRPQKTSYGRPHMLLYVTPRDVPYRRPEDVLSPQMRTSIFGLSINKSYITKMVSIAQQVEDTKGSNMNYVSQIKWQEVYISFIKIFIKLYSCFINLINFFHQNCLILQQN